LVETLVREFKRRNYNLATIKHSAHDFDLDHPGKDSWRFAEAGSNTIALSSPRKVALVRFVDREANLEELLHLIGEDFDLVLVEGFKNSNIGVPKVEVHRKEVGDMICSPEELMALVTDEPLDIAVPQFSPDDIGPLVDLMEQQLAEWRGIDEVLLMVNDAPVHLDPYVKRNLHKTLMEMVSALKCVEEVSSLRISLRRGQS